MKDRIIEIVAGYLGESIDEVSTDSSLANDLGADCLDIVEIVMKVEAEFGIYITDEEMEEIRTVGDLIKLVKND